MRSAVAQHSYKLAVETNDILGCLKKARNERRTETKAFVKKINQCLDIHPICWSCKRTMEISSQNIVWYENA